jgi:uridine kinase
MSIEKTIEAIRKLSTPAIVALSGFGGSGKSTIARQIGAALDAPVICVDSFYRATAEIYRRWEVIDYARLTREVFQPFGAGERVLQYAEFDWAQGRIGDVKTITVNNILIVEGIGLFRPELMKYFSHTIWVNCSLDVAIARGKKRDRDEYGLPPDKRWDGIWRENELQCLAEFSPIENATCVIRND